MSELNMCISLVSTMSYADYLACVLCSLYGNELTGTIPVEIGQLTKLWHVGKDFSP